MDPFDRDVGVRALPSIDSMGGRAPRSLLRSSLDGTLTKQT